MLFLLSSAVRLIFFPVHKLKSYFLTRFTELKLLTSKIKKIKLHARHPSLTRSHAIKKKAVLFKAKKKRKKSISQFFKKRLYGFQKNLRRERKSFSLSIITIVHKTKQATIVLARFIFFPLLFLNRANKTRAIARAGKKALMAEAKAKKKVRRTRPTFWYSVKIFFWGGIFATFFIFAPLLVLIFLSDLPNPSTLSTTYIPKTTKIYDRNGNLLYDTLP